MKLRAPHPAIVAMLLLAVVLVVSAANHLLAAPAIH